MHEHTVELPAETDRSHVALMMLTFRVEALAHLDHPG
jgi:hypothetical protein